MQVKIYSEADWVIWHFRQGRNTIISSTWPEHEGVRYGKLAKAVWMHLLFPLIKAAPGLFQTYHSWTGAILTKALISCLTWEANSEKVRHPSLLAFLRLPFLANLSAISLPQTFTRNGNHWKCILLLLLTYKKFKCWTIFTVDLSARFYTQHMNARLNFNYTLLEISVHRFTKTWLKNCVKKLAP